MIAGAQWYYFDLNVIRVKAIQDKHICVAGGQAVEELACLVCKDLDVRRYVLGVDGVSACAWGGYGVGLWWWRLVAVELSSEVPTLWLAVLLTRCSSSVG